MEKEIEKEIKGASERPQDASTFIGCGQEEKLVQETEKEWSVRKEHHLNYGGRKTKQSMLYEGEIVSPVKCCWRVRQAKSIHEIPAFHLLEVLVPTNETAALSRPQSHLLLEKPNL